MKQNPPKLLGVLAMCAAFCLQLSAAFAQNTAFTLLTITNPTPAIGDSFGVSVAGVGIDRMLIGAYFDDTGAFDAGAAYLFSTNGALLTTFTNPAPKDFALFGSSVAAVGADRVLIGAYGDNTGAFGAGAAYLFSVNGALLTTFTNPVPASGDSFGTSVAAVGADRVLIAANGDDTGAVDAGVAYLFSTNGALLTTFTNPTPETFDLFGSFAAAVGSDRVLIGAYLDDTGMHDAGAAYLFSTNGTLLTTFTNPIPADSDRFGISVAAVGTEWVLIGASLGDAGATDAGAAYLFRTNGTLLTTFTNPAPADSDYFGYSVAAVGTDGVLIGTCFADTSESDAGMAYLFGINGALLTTFTNPMPASGDWFGWSVAAVGTTHLLIAAYSSNTGATNTGAAYLYSAALPQLSIHLTPTNTVAVSWPSYSLGWELQQNANNVNSLNWSNVTNGIQVSGATKTLIVDPAGEHRFFRLFKP